MSFGAPLNNPTRYQVRIFVRRRPDGPGDETYATGNANTASRSACRDIEAGGDGSWAVVVDTETGEGACFEQADGQGHPRGPWPP